MSFSIGGSLPVIEEEESGNIVEELPLEDETRRPTYITVRAVRIDDHDTIIRDLRNFLVQRTYQRIRQFYPNTPTRELNRIRGFLMVTNNENGSVRVSNDDEEDSRIAAISVERMDNLILKLGRSAEEVNVLNLEWQFQIIWPNVVGAKVKPPTWFSSRKKDPWIRLWETPDDLSCLAYTLIHLMANQPKNFFRAGSEQGLRLARNHTLALMEKMQWTKYVNLLSECKKFVEHDDYNHLNLVIIAENQFKSYPYKIFTGEKYEPKVDANGVYLKDDKIIYLFQDSQSFHVAGTKTIQVLVKNFLGQQYVWCYKCHTATNVRTETHVCDGENSRKEYKNLAK